MLFECPANADAASATATAREGMPSINLRIKLELINMLIHQVTGIIQVKRSPHLPCGLSVDAILGLNFNVLYLKTLATNK